MDITYGLYHISRQSLGLCTQGMERGFTKNENNDHNRGCDNYIICNAGWLWQCDKMKPHPLKGGMKIER